MAGCYMRKMWSSFMSKTVGSKLPLLLYSSRLFCPSMQDGWLSPAVASFFKFISYLSQVYHIFPVDVDLESSCGGYADKQQGRDDLMSPMPAKMNTV
ncbi:hypothetical protein MTR67_020613 [Solanum verrucosum]|uniref:Uncharacterized protein n=1 Tax=Solanum verrucosum TaxID=315347 RepID=A0AAF0QS04_SOLVR|nr:hypothetical protein MTR67_020613 [Solanum verrucosum]